jgi:DNA-directed RNA polymerase specialized sigma24 family protein
MDRESVPQAVYLEESVAPSAEAQLLEQLRRGDADAGHQFVRDNYPAIYRYLLSLTGRPDLAEDLTQETFLQAWRHLDQFEGRAPLRAWLYRIARREFLHTLRSRRAQTTLDDLTRAWSRSRWQALRGENGFTPIAARSAARSQCSGRR